MPRLEKYCLAVAVIRPPSWSVSMTLGGPNGLIQRSCRPLSSASADLLVTILACVSRTRVNDVLPGVLL
eukprot:2198928-Prorocentrum_lima.AAC.1